MHGTGSRDKTSRHCLADDPNGKLDIPRASAYWLKDAASHGMRHICWDSCMFSNEVLETPSTWQHILEAMVKVDKALRPSTRFKLPSGGKPSGFSGRVT